jgi:hypothetical protein
MERLLSRLFSSDVLFIIALIWGKKNDFFHCLVSTDMI